MMLAFFLASSGGGLMANGNGFVVPGLFLIFAAIASAFR